jgi:hypothetical protein
VDSPLDIPSTIPGTQFFNAHDSVDNDGNRGALHTSKYFAQGQPRPSISAWQWIDAGKKIVYVDPYPLPSIVSLKSDYVKAGYTVQPMATAATATPASTNQFTLPAGSPAWAQTLLNASQALLTNQDVTNQAVNTAANSADAAKQAATAAATATTGSKASGSTGLLVVGAIAAFLFFKK